MSVFLAFSLTFALLSQGASCGRAGAYNVSGDRTQSVQAGTSWGGEHARADVGSDGVSFEFDCAHGASDGPLVLAEDGSFDLKGFFVAERGPLRAGQKEKRHPARYIGRVRGETMTLDVHLTESGLGSGPFTLTRGRAARLTKCL